MTEAEIWKILQTVEDPEVPVLDVVNMGVVRKVEVSEDSVKVTITPTYSGCPAMDVIGENIKSTLTEKGVKSLEVDLVINPPWTTDWLTPIAKQRLKEYGIAPPVDGSPDKSKLLTEDTVVTCPNCGSNETTMVSIFGSTACKAHYKCTSCLEPFDYFKCL